MPRGPSDADGAPAVRATWLHGVAEPFPAYLHPVAQASPPVGVVVVSPFGWEELSSYRPRREWAEHLAARGVPAVRFDLPGQGDAGGGPADAGRVAAWTDATTQAVAWLRAETGCARVVCVAFTLGGLIALRAAGEGTAIDDLILWATPARGRAFLRALRAFARMEDGLLDDADRAAGDRSVPDGWLVAGGYALSGATRDDVEALEAAALAAALAGEGRRALLLGRDGVGDTALREALQAAGVTVEEDDGRGFGGLLVEPQFAELPAEAVARVDAFLDAAPAGPAIPRDAPAAPRASDTATLGSGDTAWHERFAETHSGGGRLFGVVAEPDGPAREDVAVLLLGGTGHRIGPNRMWTEAARRWTAQGLLTCRADLAGAGESTTVVAPDVPGLYTPAALEEAHDALALLPPGPPGRRTVVVGLCAGGYWAVHLAAQPGTAITPLAVNVPTLRWDLSGHAERLSRHYGRLLLSRHGVRRLLTGDVAVGRVLRVLAQRVRGLFRRAPRGPEAPPDREAAMLDALQEAGARPYLLFAGREGLGADLTSRPDLATRWPDVHVDALHATSDLHTLRPLWVQRELHERLDAALRSELARS